MKLDEFTVKVLTNYASINPGVVIKKGNEIVSMATSKTILAEAVVPDVFPVDIALGNLTMFLGLLKIHADPEIEFNDNHLRIRSGKDSVKFYYASPSEIASPSKKVNFTSSDVSFELLESQFAYLVKTAGVLGVTDLCLFSENGVLKMDVSDKTNVTSSNASVEVSDYEGDEVRVYWKIDALKILPGDYEVSVNKKGISRFKNKKHDLTYFVSLQS